MNWLWELLGRTPSAPDGRGGFGAAPMITLEGAIAAGIVFAVTLAAAFAARGQLARLRARASWGGGATLYIAERLSFVLVLLIGLVAALSALGLDLVHLSIFLGALGVGVGLGLQQLVRNFLSGVSLLLDRSLEIGDFVELEAGVRGEVREVGVRATRIVTNDQVDILVPNAALLEERLANWTRGGNCRRFRIAFLARFGVDKDVVRLAALEAARGLAITRPDEGERRTQVWLTGFAERGLAFELVVWPTREAVKRPDATEAAYCWAIEDALRRAGLDVPPPQLDVRLAPATPEPRAAERRVSTGARPSEPR